MSDVADKWSEEVAKRGFSQIPNYLLLINQFLEKENRLSPVELLIIIQLVGAWWKKEKLPFPSISTLASRCGVSERQTQRAINKLVENNIIERVKRRSGSGIISSNAYNLDPLVRLLYKIAKAFPNDFPRNIAEKDLISIGE